MKYTKSKKADKKVEEDLEKIKKVLIDEFNPISIILFGGFGKGEGTYEIVNGRIVPLNDYDVYVVTKNRIPDEKLERVGEKCSAMLGKGGGEFVENYEKVYDKNEYFHVDLRWLDYNKLGRMKRVNRTYELKYGSTVIYGEDIRKKINDIKIPLSESFRYLTNPVGHLLLCMDERRLKGNFKKDEKFYALHHIVKTYLACASSLIISAGKFEPTYSETVKLCDEIYGKKFPELMKKIKHALDMKLHPEKRNVKDIVKAWFVARDDLTFVMKFIAEKNYGIRSKNVLDLCRKLYKKLPYVYFEPYIPLPGFFARAAFFSQYCLNLFYFIRSGYSKVLYGWKDVGIKIILAGLLVLHGLDEKRLLEPAYDYIKSFAPVKGKRWEDLRKGVLFAFDKYYSQKLI